ncbi:MAG: hypothetical protein EA355_01995 [Rhodobacteraceae bacterium]|nr:MAG: hypothetical protein EA355_01995 [Paracoccaceae bacterium]
MPEEVARKLSLTAALLRCQTRKELAARFRAVNPATDFDLERSYKWMQGRALPRSRKVYDDWALVLGAERSGGWVAECSFEEFRAEMCALFGIDPAELPGRAETLKAVPSAPLPPMPGASDYLVGDYLAYSWAWSPRYAGSFIRGWLGLKAARRGEYPVRYAENLPGGFLEFTGYGLRRRNGLSLRLSFAGGAGNERMAFELLSPGWPGHVLCGFATGDVINAPAPQVAVTRVVLLRIDPGPSNDPSWDRVAMPTAYINKDTEALVADMVRHAMPTELAEALAPSVLAFLDNCAAPGADRVALDDLGALSHAVDPQPAASAADVPRRPAGG